MNFRDFGLAEPLLRAVLQEGYSVATPIQAQAIPTVLEGHDVIGIAQTGTGKTAAFALPILHRLLGSTAAQKSGPRPIRVLVLASTRELAVQIHESFTSYGAFAALRITTIYGGVGQQPQVNALRKGVDIVVATPGRLMDLIKQGHVHLESLQTLVLDEADRMLDMGFFPAIRRILEYVPRKRQTLMFSATMKPEIRELANSILHNPVSISIVPKQKTTELVEQSVCFVPQKQKTRLLIELITKNNPSRAIVFSRTKHGADRIVRNLTAAGLRSEAIHANKSQNKRQRILEDFKGPRPPILVATDIAARGIDVDLVSHVFLHDMPTEEETYVHRIGRSGRAGATGVAISLCDSEERRMLKSIEKLIGMKINVLEVPGFDMNHPVEEVSRSESGRDGRRGQDRQDRSDRPSRPGQPSRIQGLQGRAPQSSAYPSRETQGQSGPRRSNREEPPRKDLGRAAERNRRPAAPHREADRPVPSNLGLRRQPRTASSNPSDNRPQPARRPHASESRNAEAQSHFGDGIDIETGSSSAQGDRPPARRRRRPPTRSNS